MILTGKKIEEEVRSGNITIEPFDLEMINPNSYNYRLGKFLKVYKESIDGVPVFDTIVIPETGYQLEPHTNYLCSTNEVLGSRKYAMSLIGRSSIGRLGLFLQLSADLGHVGSKHKWTLELVAAKPIIIYPFMKIGQISFWENDGDFKEYSGEHGKYSIPTESQLNFYK